MSKPFFQRQKNDKRNLCRYSAYFFSTFLLSLVLISTTSCKKKEFKNGKDLLNSEYDVSSAIQKEFDLTTYSYQEDSIRCKNTSHVLFGSYTDPVFGKMNASIYTNFLLENPGSTNFTTNQAIDSIVLSLQFNGYYGYSGSVNVSVFELDQRIDSKDTLYQFNHFINKGVDLVETGKNNIRFQPNTKVVVGTDTLSAQVRIPLKKSFAEHLIAGASSGSYDTQEAFKDYFKGLYIRTEDVFAKGKGAMYYFNMTAVNSKITIYYKDDENKSKIFKYIINKTDGTFFNHIDKDNAGTKVAALLADTSLGEKEFYAQAYGIRGIVEIPQFKDLPKNAIIHQAQLILPYTSYYADQFYPSSSVTIGYYKNNDLHKPVTISKGNLYNSSLKAFVFDLNDFTNNVIVAQNILDGIIDTHTFFIIPDNFANSSERIIFNGKLSNYKIKPQLKLIYTLN